MYLSSPWSIVPTTFVRYFGPVIHGRVWKKIITVNALWIEGDEDDDLRLKGGDYMYWE